METQNKSKSPEPQSSMNVSTGISLSSKLKNRILVLLISLFIFHPNEIMASVSKTTITDRFIGYSDSDSSKRANENTSVKKTPAVSHFQIKYSVQIISLAGYLPSNASFFKKCGRTDEHIINGQYIYTIGEFRTSDEAQKQANELVKKGYKDVFPVAFINNHKISMDEAFAVLSNW